MVVYKCHDIQTTSPVKRGGAADQHRRRTPRRGERHHGGDAGPCPALPTVGTPSTPVCATRQIRWDGRCACPEGSIHGEGTPSAGPTCAPPGQSDRAEHLWGGHTGTQRILRAPWPRWRSWLSGLSAQSSSSTAAVIMRSLGPIAFSYPNPGCAPEQGGTQMIAQSQPRPAKPNQASLGPTAAQRQLTTSKSDEAVRNVSVTPSCGICGGPLPPGRTRRWCSEACRQAAWRIRSAAPRPVQPAKPDTIYECPECEARYLGVQRCEDCNLWCRRLGPGGYCPHCDELVALSDLLRPEQLGGSPSSATPRSKERQ